MKKEFIKKIILIGMTTLITTNIYTVSASAKWAKDSNESWNWVENGVKTIGWKNIDSKWYYFNDNGTMKTGWIKDNGNWYNLSSSGEMLFGWKMIGGKWYHFNEDGSLSIGWINDNGNKYYADSNGEMQIGTIKIEDKMYTFLESGAMLESDSTNQEKKDGTSKVGYVATNSDSLNVRSDAALSSDIIGTVAKGAEVKIIDDEKNGFYPIFLSGKKGWVSSEWVNVKNSGDILAPAPVVSQVVSSNASNDNSKSDDNSKKVIDKKDNSKVPLSPVDLNGIRNTAPSLDNKYYYSDGNLFYKVKLSPPFSSGGRTIKGNCTWYAWGRAWEMTGIKPEDAGFIGNGYEWWEANKKSGKYQYGSEPRVGAIGVWKSSLPGSDGSGHVAIVEKIDNGKVYISESTWHGGPFNYKEIYSTNYMYGYIYLDKPNY